MSTNESSDLQVLICLLADEHDRVIDALQGSFSDLLKKQSEQVDRVCEVFKPPNYEALNKPPNTDDTLRACFSELLKKQGEQADRLYEALKPKPPSTNGTLRPGACFSDLLTKQDEQGDRLYKAVEGRKAKAPAIDKKTAFWNAYKSLADEHDKDFQQRYSTDLDTSLIFAGLFSAVDSAFIIQIQPQIQPHGTPLVILVAQCLLYISLGSTLLAALLAVLGKQWLMYYSTAGERGTMEARGLARQHKFDGMRKWKFDALMQTFPLLLQLGLLLFGAALSVYLRIINLTLATIVLCFTSFGCFSYLFLITSPVFSPDSPFQSPQARFVAELATTTSWRRLRESWSRIVIRPRRFIRRVWPTHFFRGSHDFLPYSTEQQSEVDWMSPENRDSHVMQPTVWRRLYASVIRHPRSLLRRVHSAYSTRIPLSTRHKNGQKILSPPLFDSPFPNPSPEVAAVSWVLETSTDPAVVTFAAEMAVQLQWPLNVDLAPQISRLRDTVLGCFEYRGVYKLTDDGPVGAVNLDKIRDGMADRVIRCGQAYCSLRALAQPLSKEESTLCCADYRPFESPELRNVVRILTGSSELMFDSIPPMDIEWTLHAYMALEPSHLPNREQEFQHFLDQADKIGTVDASNFTEYLFCIHAFLSDTNRMDLVRRDKSLFQEQLFEHLFKTLAAKLETAEISMETAANILDTTGRLAARSENNVWSYGFGDYYRQSIIYPFCSSLRQKDGWLRVVLATGLLAKNQSYSPCPGISGADGTWVYDALELVLGLAESGQWDTKTRTEVSGLFQALLYYDIPPYREESTGVKNVRLLSQALSISGDVSRLAAHVLVRSDVLVWFQHQELRNILQRAAVWSSLTNMSVELDDCLQFSRQFIQTGHAIRNIPDWQPHIRSELCAWITTFFRGDTTAKPPWDLAEEYGSVLGEIWDLPITEYDFVDAGEKALALSFMALQNFWDASFNLKLTPLWTPDKSVAAWLRCTSYVVAQTGYCDRYGQWITIPPRFKALFTHPLAASLVRVADAIRASCSALSNDVLESTATTLENLTVKLKSSAGTKELNAAGPSRNEPRYLVDRGNDWLVYSRDSAIPITGVRSG